MFPTQVARVLRLRDSRLGGVGYTVAAGLVAAGLVSAVRPDSLTCGPQCVTKCCEKFLKHSARVSLRFAELNQGQEQPKS